MMDLSLHRIKKKIKGKKIEDNNRGCTRFPKEKGSIMVTLMIVLSVVAFIATQMFNGNDQFSLRS